MTIAAHAKLTLDLRVTGVRDDGFHLIDAEMVTLDLADTVVVSPSDGESSLVVDGPYAAGIGTGSDNLVLRALSLAKKNARVQLTKHIPHGGGLGGGSADAAAVLRWAGFHDLAAASRLGADIPFCMVGGRARVSGIGEVVEPLPHVDTDITLVIPPFGVSTPLVYTTWDSIGGPRHAGSPQGANDLEPAALVAEPRLLRVRDRITDAAGVAPLLAGSGSTWFLRGHFDWLAEALPETTVVLTRTVDPA
ncbi:MAG: 4-(cytidine 5'-diphospho)-2-C-methyl-D-erythritol kinase [Acidobacteria bacterium]|nr:4-(cytidine 5'-diphospho)-2-C-methyl-D-erythritol kinase [Acidobacteriota bacterium]